MRLTLRCHSLTAQGESIFISVRGRVASMHQTAIETASSLDRVVSVIYSALSELNLQLPKSGRVETSLSAVLFGNERKLDSLALASLIVILETKLETAFGFHFDITQDDPFSS